MLDFNEMNNNKREQTSLLYKIIRVLLITLSGIIMLNYLIGIVSYITSGPSVTLFDDLTREFILQVLLMGTGLFFLIIAWFRHISYGIVSLIFIIMYCAYSSLLAGEIVLGFLSIAMAIDSIGFILLGFIKRYQSKKEYNVYAAPLADQYEGPNVFNFRI